MKKIICFFIYVFVAILSNSCQSEDEIETSSQSDLEYKEKLEKLITLSKPTDISTSKIDLSNALRFKNYEEAYNYFKNNREFVSDTIITELKPVQTQSNNTFKTTQLESLSSTNALTYGQDTQSYYQVLNDNASVSNSSISASVNANYHFYCTVQYAYTQQNYTKNYYSFNVSSSNVSSVTTAFSGIAGITPSGSLAVSAQGTSLSWTKIYQQTSIIFGVTRQFIIEVKGYITIMPSFWGSSINTLTVSHYITARYL